MIKNFIEVNKEAILRDLGILVSHDSVYAEDAEPFGKENRAVLDDALRLMEENGLRVKNLDYYCGYGEVGEGDKVIGILAHLDIVPAGDGWDSDPFLLTAKDDKVYGRGVSDDKGAVIASLYALKYLIESGYKFKNRVRLITGCNEETGSRCIAHYVKEEGDCDMAFTPDANFPGIFAEKGMCGGYIIARSDKIIAIEGGTVSNVVCKEVHATVKKDSFDIEAFKAYFKENDIEVKVLEADDIDITVYGKAAHASMPELGINAIQHLFKGLYVAKMQDPLVDYMHEKFDLDVHGSLIGCDVLKDEYTDLTLNLGVIKKVADEIRISVDIRFPVTRNTKEVSAIVVSGLLSDVAQFACSSLVEPLFFDKESPMCKALRNAYIKVTGDEKTQMEAIGGGTYAKAMKNCVAFGCEFLGEDNHIHDANECLKLESLYKQIEIYIEAIKNLDEVV